MHLVNVGGKRTFLALVLALGVGLPLAAQAYLLDFTVASINSGVLVSYAGSPPGGSPPVDSHLKVADASHVGDLRCQLGPTITPSHKILTFQPGPSVDYGSNVVSATPVGLLDGISLHGFITLPGGSSCLTRSGGTAGMSGSVETVSVPGPVPGGGNSPVYNAGSNLTTHKNEARLAPLGFQHLIANGNFDPDAAANFASSPGEFAATLVPSGNIFHHLAPSVSTLLLLGSGLMGLVGLRSRRRRGK